MVAAGDKSAVNVTETAAAAKKRAAPTLAKAKKKAAKTQSKEPTLATHQVEYRPFQGDIGGGVKLTYLAPQLVDVPSAANVVGKKLFRVPTDWDLGKPIKHDKESIVKFFAAL